MNNARSPSIATWNTAPARRLQTVPAQRAADRLPLHEARQRHRLF